MHDLIINPFSYSFITIYHFTTAALHCVHSHFVQKPTNDHSSTIKCSWACSASFALSRSGGGQSRSVSWARRVCAYQIRVGLFYYLSIFDQPGFSLLYVNIIFSRILVLCLHVM
ncbi:hypothetical protein C8R42DRAFT_775019 [Lentinula raphanica]|nr:hypothetical protein C8R42DRAFT_775019 [Lentinula raphanica]